MTAARQWTLALLITVISWSNVCTKHLLIAQQQHPLCEGQEFRVGFIHPERAPGEPLAKDAYQLIISSTVGATAIVGESRSVTITAGTAEVVVIDSCDVVRVTSDRPITVASRIMMRGNGEQTAHIPVYAWDTQYYGFSWWIDRYGLDTKTYATGKRLVIARENGTTVRYFEQRIEKTLMLDAGEYAYLSVPLDTTLVRDALTDPTKDLITASKPICVISGHPKTAVINHPDAYPSTGPYARALSRSRGTLMETMIPLSMAGQSFITAPFQYSPTRKRGLDLTKEGISSDLGDVIRFVASQDGTILQRTDRNGTTSDVLNTGVVYTHELNDAITIWSASKPVLCAQYGKSYAHITSQASLPEDDPSTDAGLPMMVCIPSSDRWIQQSTIHVPEGLLSNVTVVTKPRYMRNILIDGRPMYGRSRLDSLPAQAVMMQSMALPGSHTISVDDDSATFMAYTYGNADGLDLCQAYASHSGYDLSQPCNDTLISHVVYSGDTATYSADVLALDGCDRYGIALKYIAASTNCVAVGRINGFTVVRAKNADSAFADIVVITQSGRHHQERIMFRSTSVPEMRTSTAYSLHPNPAADQVTIVAHHNVTIPLHIDVSDITGLVVMRAVTSSAECTLDVRHCAPGAYIVTINDQVIPVMIIR